LALRLLARDEYDAARASARVYAWNTLGAIAGAVLAGFVVIPALGYSGSVRLVVCANLVLAFLAAAQWSSQRRGLLVATGVLALLALLLFRPAPPERLMRSSSLAGMSSEGAIVYQGVGRSASVVLLEQQGTWEVRCNGLPEATIEPRGAPPFGRNTTWWLGALPLLARPAARTMLVIGFGGGVTMEYLPPTLETIDTIELEPEVIEANRRVSTVRALDPLADPRVHVHLGDARGALALTSERWDVIVSQPSHPWTAGASHLYTREFLQEARAHLSEGGVFVQWMLAGFLDEELLRVLAATILDVFPHARLYQPIPPMLVFLASDAPLDPEREIARTGE
jgi:spermidine synthase